MTETAGPTDHLADYLNLIFSRKAQDVLALDVGELTSYADTIIIVTANSARQVTSIADHIYTSMKAKNTLALGTEGMKDGKWALLDYGDVIIHIFDRETKALYNIAGLWSDAPRIDLSGFQADPLAADSATDDQD